MIQNKNFILQSLKEGDLEEFYNLTLSSWSFFSGEVCSFITFKKRFYETGFWDEKIGCLLIKDKRDRTLGSLWYKALFPLEGYDLGGLLFREEDRNRGVMSEALSLFTTYLFSERRVNRLQMAIPDYHRAAIALAQKSGFTFEGIARQAVFRQGKYIDLCIYSMLRSEIGKVHGKVNSPLVWEKVDI